ncbi:hypothetical protein SAMN05216526_1782 [Ectothiorhodosinus mongolicus]|uniref:Uncharacterized protein n=1 Tax=Ectothiorhodosinus mongolicus TaxID=233100 RepID=A0A1R3W7Z5_9GAMM|nr:hypothetical protein [Ectothiorhodosinus mongolicus]ULX57594.1 hypothetical protein CKX93_07935 [Ectothiorhodosinus mongolicus]SIT73000.1 hypothetical protein SAMN05216526_1782 [Ectothiorhodosinus mongolicus]
MDKPIETLSAKELYEMAKRREQEEWERTRTDRQREIKALRAERRSLLNSHRKALRQLQQAQNAELASLDSRIADLTGRAPRKRGNSGNSGSNGRSPKGQQTDTILKIINTVGETTARAVKAEAEAMGLVFSNVHQTLGYLKRQGKIEQVGRGIYRSVQ